MENFRKHIKENYSRLYKQLTNDGYLIPNISHKISAGELFYATRKDRKNIYYSYILTLDGNLKYMGEHKIRECKMIILVFYLENKTNFGLEVNEKYVTTNITLYDKRKSSHYITHDLFVAIKKTCRGVCKCGHCPIKPFTNREKETLMHLVNQINKGVLDQVNQILNNDYFSFTVCRYYYDD